ncbi:acyl-CoA thioesterase [Jatrophihabitans fulvus]
MDLTEDPGSPPTSAPSLTRLLELDDIDRDIYRSTELWDDPEGLYGGQVMAQALRAASLTVRAEYLPHSLHAYFVRPGNPLEPVVYRVQRDRDGRSYAARRVVALQFGKTLFSMSCSFHVPEDGPDSQAEPAPPAPDPDAPGTGRLRTRAVGVEFRDADQGSDLPTPARVWVRPAAPGIADDPHLFGCFVTYVSDMCTGLFRIAPFDWNVRLTSIDHALWLYRPARPDWLLMDLAGESVGRGRGLYRGRIFDRDGTLVAGLAQESLFRRLPQGRRHTIVRVPERS